MKRKMKNTMIFIGVYILFSILSCDLYDRGGNEEGEESDAQYMDDNISISKTEQSKIVLKARYDDQKTLISIYFNRAEQNDGPRMAEIYLKHPTEWNFSEAVEGNAVSDAQKQLIVQEAEEGLLRVLVIASDNINEMQSGTIATLKFEREDGERGTVEILTDRPPIFAPEEANEGLLVGDPVEI